jgi:hypothetical protein
LSQRITNLDELPRVATCKPANSAGRVGSFRYGRCGLAAIRALALLLPAGAAMAAPPPVGSPEWDALSPFAQWFAEQRVPGTSDICCNIADGRTVDVRINGKTGRYEIKFRHPETIRDAWPLPSPDVWYDVPPIAVLRVANPTGKAIAWWSPGSIVSAYNSPIRCFAPIDLY